MADKTPLKIAPELFRWARESVGLSLPIAARRIGVKTEKLEEWEGKEALPTPRQLEKAADAYKRPVAMFFLPAPPKEPPLPIDFRSPKLVREGEFSTATRLAIRRARWLKEIYSEIAEEPDRADIPQMEDNRPESVAEVIRGWLASTLNTVKNKQPNHALRIWRESLESAGLLVFQFPMPMDDAHAFSLSDGVPAIVLNSKDAYARRIFSTVHELAHLMLRRPGLCNPSEYVEVEGSTELEVRCNAAAGLALVPDAALADQPAALRVKRGADALDMLESLARNFAVSRQVILRRLFELDLMNRASFHRIMDLLQREYQEQLKLKTKRKIVVKPSTKAVGQLGKKFVTNVLSAHERGAISDADVAEYLGVRLGHIDSVQELVGAE
jgi:Zn-dependent peptidase ImmA (M78 family)